jgi:hypothetical protein
MSYIAEPPMAEQIKNQNAKPQRKNQKFNLSAC